MKAIWRAEDFTIDIESLSLAQLRRLQAEFARLQEVIGYQIAEVIDNEEEQKSLN